MPSEDMEMKSSRHQPCPICGKTFDTYWPVETCSPDCDAELDKRETTSRPLATARVRTYIRSHGGAE